MKIKSLLFTSLLIPTLCFAQNVDVSNDLNQRNTSQEIINNLTNDLSDNELKTGETWKEIFYHLVKQKSWDKVKSIEHIGIDNFKKHPFWDTYQFQRVWQYWKYQNALRIWSNDKKIDGFWSLAQSESLNKPSLGLRKERASSWWMIISMPKQIGSRKIDGWFCSSTCFINIENKNGKKVKLEAKVAIGDNKNQVWSLGSPIPINFIINDEDYWTVSIEDDTDRNEIYKFDMSYVRTVCRERFNQCF